MSETTNLKLFKHDNSSTNTNPFNVEQSLNENWDKIDTTVTKNSTDIANVKLQVSKLEKNTETLQTSIGDIKDEQSTQNKDISDLQKSEELQNEKIIELQKENIMLKDQIPTGQVSGEEISLRDSAKMPLKEFSIDINNSAHLIVTNKNILDLGESSKNNITFNKNRVIIDKPIASTTANNCNLLNNKFVSNKTVSFTFIANGTIAEGSNVKMLFRTKSNSYKVQKIYEAKTYTNDISFLKVNFAADEVISEVYLFVSDANINMTIDVQVEINEATEFIEHEETTFDISTDNLSEAIEEIKKEGTYKGTTHYYTTDNLKATIKLTYYKDLEAIIDNQKQMQETLNNVQAQLLEMGGN